MSDQNEDDFLTKRLLAERYKKNPKTIERWTASGVLPAPDMVVAKQPYWKRQTIENSERERMGVHDSKAVTS
jgi:hypothetical protein